MKEPETPAANSSIRVGEVVAALDAQVPFDTCEQWDVVGLICGDPAATVDGCCVALNPTPGSIEYAARAGANLLVTHHPPYLEAPLRVLPIEAPKATCAGATVSMACSRGVNVISLHTNLDASPLLQGLLADSLGLSYIRPFKELGEGRAYGQVARMRTDRNTAEELSRWVLEAVGITPRVWGNRLARIDDIAIINGSAGSFVEDILAQRIGCAIVGEIGYHQALALAAHDVVIVEVGHDVSELPLLPVISQLLSGCGVSSDIITDIGPHEYWWQPT